MLYVRSGAALKRLALDFDALAADVYWIRAIQHYGGDRLGRRRPAPKYELLYPLLDHHDVARSVLHHRLPVRRDLPERGVSRRPGRPDQAIALLRKGHRRAAGRSGSTTTTSRSSITGTCAICTAAAEWFRSARPISRTRPTGCAPLAARCSPRAATARRRGSCGSRSCSRRRRGCGARRARACCSSTRSTRSISCRRCVQRFPPAGRRAATRGSALDAPARAPRHPAGSVGHAVRDRPGDRRVTRVARSPASSPMPETPAPDSDDRIALPLAVPRHPRACRRQLSQRLHPPHAARRLDRSPAIELPALRLSRCAGSTTSRSSATPCSAAAAASAARRSRSAIRSSSS